MCGELCFSKVEVLVHVLPSQSNRVTKKIEKKPSSRSGTVADEPAFARTVVRRQHRDKQESATALTFDKVEQQIEFEEVAAITKVLVLHASSFCASRGVLHAVSPIQPSSASGRCVPLRFVGTQRRLRFRRIEILPTPPRSTFPVVGCLFLAVQEVLCVTITRRLGVPFIPQITRLVQARRESVRGNSPSARALTTAPSVRCTSRQSSVMGKIYRLPLSPCLP